LIGATKAKIAALQVNLDRITPLARSMHDADAKGEHAARNERMLR
jgi:hypothetical protein